MRKEKGELTRLENSKHRRKVALFKKKNRVTQKKQV